MLCSGAIQLQMHDIEWAAASAATVLLQASPVGKLGSMETVVSTSSWRAEGRAAGGTVEVALHVHGLCGMTGNNGIWRRPMAEWLLRGLHRPYLLRPRAMQNVV